MLCLPLKYILIIANIIQCGKPYALLLVLRMYMVTMTKQMQLCVVILRKCKEIDQYPHIISTSAASWLTLSTHYKRTYV